MTAKKICFLVTDAVSFNVLCRGQLEYFRDSANVDMTLVCGGSKEELERLRGRNVGRVIDMGFVRKPSLPKDFFALLRLFIFFLFNRYDLVVYSTPKALLLGSIAAALSLQRRRLALIRGRAYENFIGRKRVIYSFLDRMCMFFSHRAVFIASSLRDAYVSEGLIVPKKTHVLGAGSSNGVDTARYARSTIDTALVEKARSELGLTEDDYIVSMVGRVCFDKGISDLKNVVLHTSNAAIKFLVVGPVEDDFSKNVLNELLESGRVKYLPYSNNIPIIFCMSNLHLFLSHREGFGNVAIEAAASGVPTLAYDVVGIRDSVLANVSGLKFSFGDAGAIADFIELAVVNPAEVKLRFSGSVKWAVDEFEQKAVWDRYMTFYLEQSQ